MKLMKCLPCLIMGSLLLFSHSAFSQLNWDTDTLSAEIAKASQAEFKSDLRRGRKATSYVNFPIEKLSAVVDRCKKAGVDNLQFMIVTLRPEEVNQYARKYGNLSNEDRQDLAGRQILLIKVPRSAFLSMSGSSILRGNSSLAVALLALGVWPANDWMGIPATDDSLYLSIGVICPPPTSCN